jgi:hypothetical protein
MITYIVEKVQVNRVVTVLYRSRYYENADDVYCDAKRERYLELKLLKYDKDNGRVLLKFSNRSVRSSKNLMKDCSDEQT